MVWSFTGKKFCPSFIHILCVSVPCCISATSRGKRRSALYCCKLKYCCEADDRQLGQACSQTWELRPMLTDACRAAKMFTFLDVSLILVERPKASSLSVLYDPKCTLSPQKDDQFLKHCTVGTWWVWLHTQCWLGRHLWCIFWAIACQSWLAHSSKPKKAYIYSSGLSFGAFKRLLDYVFVEFRGQ